MGERMKLMKRDEVTLERQIWRSVSYPVSFVHNGKGSRAIVAEHEYDSAGNHRLRLDGEVSPWGNHEMIVELRRDHVVYLAFTNYYGGDRVLEAREL